MKRMNLCWLTEIIYVSQNYRKLRKAFCKTKTWGSKGDITVTCIYQADGKNIHTLYFWGFWTNLWKNHWRILKLTFWTWNLKHYFIMRLNIYQMFCDVKFCHAWILFFYFDKNTMKVKRNQNVTTYYCLTAINCTRVG